MAKECQEPRNPDTMTCRNCDAGWFPTQSARKDPKLTVYNSGPCCSRLSQASRLLARQVQPVRRDGPHGRPLPEPAGSGARHRERPCSGFLTSEVRSCTQRRR